MKLLIMIVVLGLSACTPTMMAPPTPPLDPTHHRSFGLGYSAHKQVNSSAERGNGGSPIMNGGQLWLRRKPKSSAKGISDTESGLLISFGQTSFGAVGTYYRKKINGLPKSVYLGTQIEWGWIWGGLGLPMGLQVLDGVWVYIQPTIRYPAYLMAHLPAGLSIDLGHSMRLDAQGGVSAFGVLFGKSTPGSPIHNRIFAYGGLGLSTHW